MNGKKFDFNFYLNAVAGVIALVGLITLIVTNSTAGFGVTNGGLAILLAVVGVAAIACATYTSMSFGSQNIITGVVKVVALGALMAAFGILLADRAELASGLFTWDSHNDLGWSVFTVSVVSGACFLVSSLILIVNAFIDNKKNA